MNEYIKRHLEEELILSAKNFPAIVLGGPRQAGKTTLLNHLFNHECEYVSLDEPDIQLLATSNPRGFMNRYQPPVIFDEVQHVPNLLNYVKNAIDKHRSDRGQFFLSGSQNLLLLGKVTETLAGRCAIMTLLPLSMREQRRTRLNSTPWETKIEKSYPAIELNQFWTMLLRGGYPELYDHPEIKTEQWCSSYVRSYLERDVRTIRQVADLTQFQVFLRLLAARSAQLLNLTSLATEIGVAVNTVKQWLSILEATHQIIVVRPFYLNIGKRMVKQPKIYFTDTGLLCYLVGLASIEHAMSGPMSGVLVETTVLMELYKRCLNRGIEPRIYFYRTSYGIEVDFILEHHGELIPIEVKQTATPNPTMAKSVMSFIADYPKAAKHGWVVHLGDMVAPLTKNVNAIPFSAL